MPETQFELQLNDCKYFEKWKTDATKKYLQSQLLARSIRVDIKLKDEVASDQVAYNILYLKEKKEFPTRSPQVHKTSVLRWMTSFRQFALHEMKQLTADIYLKNANLDKYRVLRKSPNQVFTSFKELKDYHKTAETKAVCDSTLKYFNLV